jgi:dihydrolipoamide dehydrogenase
MTENTITTNTDSSTDVSTDTDTGIDTTVQVDIAIIGAGPGGYATALRAAQLGKSVILIERDETLGGTCLNRGCIPSKALITASRTMDTIHQAHEVGIDATINSVDFGTLLAYKNRMVDTMTSGLAGLLAHRGVTVLRGDAAITDAPGRIIQVTPSEPETQVRRFVRAGIGEDIGQSVNVQAADIVLATGSRPKTLPQHDFSGALIDSTHALSLIRVPASAVIIGSGAIAVEFASLWNAGGCAVTLLIRKDRVLSAWNRRTGLTLTRELKRRGINIVTHSAVTSVDVGVNLGATVHYTQEGHDGESTAFGEVALAAIGREPNTQAAWLEGSHIELTDAGFVHTDELGRTGVPGIWAAGDITEGDALANRAFEQGIVIAESIAGLNPKPVNDDTVARVVFSSPEAASVGCTLDQASSRDDLANVEETVFPMMSNARMLMSGSSGSMSLISGEHATEPGRRVVLGAHIVAPNASDLIAEAEQLVGNRVPLSDAARLIHPHPTFSETFGEALLKADGRPLHTR